MLKWAHCAATVVCAFSGESKTRGIDDQKKRKNETNSNNKKMVSCGTIRSHLSCLINKCRCWSVCACACACMCFCDQLSFALHNIVTFTITINHVSRIISHCDLNATHSIRNMVKKSKNYIRLQWEMTRWLFRCARDFSFICLTFWLSVMYLHFRIKNKTAKNASELKRSVWIQAKM